jgi:hypothetical protein
VAFQLSRASPQVACLVVSRQADPDGGHQLRTQGAPGSSIDIRFRHVRHGGRPRGRLCPGVFAPRASTELQSKCLEDWIWACFNHSATALGDGARIPRRPGRCASLGVPYRAVNSQISRQRRAWASCWGHETARACSLPWQWVGCVGWAAASRSVSSIAIRARALSVVGLFAAPPGVVHVHGTYSAHVGRRGVHASLQLLCDSAVGARRGPGASN